VQSLKGVQTVDQVNQSSPTQSTTPGSVVALKGNGVNERDIPSLSTPQQGVQKFPDAAIAQLDNGQQQVNFGDGNSVGGLNQQQAQRIQASLQQGRQPSTFNTDNFVRAQQSQLISDLAQMAKNGEITPRDALNRINQVEARQQREQQQGQQQQFQQNLTNLAQAGDARGVIAALASTGNKEAITALGKFEEKNGQFIPAFDDDFFEKQLGGTRLGTKDELFKLKQLVPKLSFEEAKTSIANLKGRKPGQDKTDKQGLNEIDKVIEALMKQSGVPNKPLFQALLGLDIDQEKNSIS
jgi:hypothetical protein